MDYLDFDLEIGEGTGREYPVAVLRSPAGEARATMRLPFDELQMESRLKDLQIALLRSGGTRRRAPSKEEQTVQDFGRSLFEALMVGDVRSLYDVSMSRAEQAGQGLRLRLRIASPYLAALPWEFLYDDRRDEFVCLSMHTPIVRYLELPNPPRPLLLTPPLRILGMIASPTDTMRLDVERERQRVEQALAGLIEQGIVELEWLAGQTSRDLQRAMRRGPWHIFHFVGHGEFDANVDEGLVLFCDDQGKARRFRATQLGRMLADHRTLRLAILNACEGAKGSDRDIFSSTASILVQRGIPAVLAMQYEITDRAAIELTRAFYEALADEFPVDAAVAEARKAVSWDVANNLEWGTPVLYMRAPDGALFDLTAQGETPPPTRPDKPEAPPNRPKEELEPAAEPAAGRQERIETPTAKSAEAVGSALPDFLIIEKPIHLELIRIPAGEFLMGDDKKPVYVDEFYIGKYPITHEQYALFSRDHKIPNGKADHPVVSVTWHKAVAFCHWLSKETEREFRLPLEEEWEKAARGGLRIGGADGRLRDNPESAREYPWGKDKPTRELCNISMYVGRTTPVGKYSPAGDSPYGVADMVGNVWEWTASKHGRDGRVLRGGAFYLDVKFVNCAALLWKAPDYKNSSFGFRVVASS